MSERGFRLFEAYVANKLNDPALATLSAEDHADNLVAEATAAGIPIVEITEEIGPIADALAIVKNNRNEMPTGPKGQKRPADVIGNAVKVMRIATGEEAEEFEKDGKDPAAKALGAKGGRKRAENMTPERRAEIAKKAARARWKGED